MSDEKLIECPICDGCGQVPEPKPCPTCGYYGCRTMDCKNCNGTGYIDKKES